MEYESTILKRLIDTYGVVGNPRYISEIIKEFIVRGKECFPNLFTYQADWLAHIDEFGLNPTYTVSYTGQSIYAPNTLERPVKRAILKGSTKYRDIDTGEVLDAFEDGRNLELVSVKMPVLTTTGKNLFDGELEMGTIISTTGELVDSTTEIRSKNFIPINDTFTISRNDAHGALAVRYYDINKNFLGIATEGGINDGVNNKTYVPLANTHYAKFKIMSTNLSQNIQIEYGTQPTTYEPFKSNILSVNEDVTLRGIGVVQDTLDCLTGEVTERIGEIVFSSSDGFNYLSNQDDGNFSSFAFIKNVNRKPGYSGEICDRLKRIANYMVNENGIYYYGNSGKLELRLDTTNFISRDLIGLNDYLSKNPITVQYPLTTESVKTVDLTIHDKDHQKVERLTSFEGGTHFTTKSLEGSPLPTLEVDVVVDLEETLMMCSTEGNTM